MKFALLILMYSTILVAQIKPYVLGDYKKDKMYFECTSLDTNFLCLMDKEQRDGLECYLDRTAPVTEIRVTYVLTIATYGLRVHITPCREILMSEGSTEHQVILALFDAIRNINKDNEKRRLEVAAAYQKIIETLVKELKIYQNAFARMQKILNPPNTPKGIGKKI